jgi:two-component system NtrC family response regulator
LLIINKEQPNMAKILIVDDDKTLCGLFSNFAIRLGHQSCSVHTVEDALKSCNLEYWDLVLLDLELPDGNGLSILPDILKSPSSPEVIIITGTGNIQGAELAFKFGAWDFIPKPINPVNVKLSISRVLEYRNEKNAANKPKLLLRDGIIGESSALKACLESVAQAAATETGVLVTGETGTGKELISRAIHNNSARSEGRFVVVDCASLPESLIESALFGHEKGAFTGAGKSHIGMVKQAEYGTLFLDEVGELSPSIQKTFLRVLQEHSFRTVGGNVETESDFRLVAATNRDLDAMVKAGNFRKDLLYRLQSITIHLPMLKDRRKDIISLVIHHLEKKCAFTGSSLKGYSPEFLKMLQAYDWPGNVRELLNTLDHTLAIAGDAPILYPIHLPPQLRIPQLKAQLPNEQPARQDSTPLLFREDTLPPIREYKNTILENAEKEYLLELMRRTKGKIKEACKISGLSESRIHVILKKYNTPRFRERK